ncbi:MAG: hypothetical protein K0R72_164 [Clostridia bacterium]|jgi:hypothetical protein|nr:hypothetical protein [Clostridia bacterium]
MENIFSQYLDSHKYVVENSDHVKINLDKLDKFTNELNIQNSIHWLNNLPFGINNLSVEELINFLLIYHAIGFCYWGEPKWEVEYESKKYDGAFGLICAFAKEMKTNNKFLKFKNLSLMPYEEFERILKGNIEIPLIKERYKIIVEVSKTVNEKMNSNFYEYIKNINKDIELFNLIIDNFDSFEDISNYKNKKVYYYKRAQLLVSDILHIKQDKQNIKVNFSNLIGCADYKIPQVLRDLDMVEYDDELTKLIDNTVQIEKESAYEIEIRSTMITVVNEIKNKLQNKYDAITINDYIWMQGQDKNNIKRPYHRTRTTAY